MIIAINRDRFGNYIITSDMKKVIVQTESPKQDITDVLEALRYHFSDFFKSQSRETEKRTKTLAK